MPPPTASSRSPARTAWSIRPAARMPDAQTLLMVSDETSLGIPALICACREGICPVPAWSTWPMITCCTCSGATSARSSAALMAIPPSSVGCSEESPPPSFPTGVRAEPRITVRGMGPSAIKVRARMRVSSTTQAPPDTGADTIAVGVFEGEPIAHDVDGALQGLVDSGEARTGPAQARRRPRRRQPLRARRARQARGVRRRARPRGRRGGRRPGARAGHAQALLGDPAPRRRAGLRRGHRARRLRVPRVQDRGRRRRRSSTS